MGVRGASVEVSSSEKLWWEQVLGQGGRRDSLTLHRLAITLVSDWHFDCIYPIEEVCKVYGSITLVRLKTSMSDSHCDR